MSRAPAYTFDAPRSSNDAQSDLPNPRLAPVTRATDPVMSMTSPSLLDVSTGGDDPRSGYLEFHDGIQYNEMNAIGIPTARSAPRWSTTTSWCITVDRVEKKNAFTPKIMDELQDALTLLDDDPELFVGVLTFAGDHTTAGLEMPLFFSDEARRAAAERKAAQTSEPVDPFSLGRRLTKPRITAVQGITFTIGIEIALGGDIIVAASDLRMCQLEPKRGLAPLGGATVRYVQRAGWGNAMYHLLLADEFGADEAYRIGLVQEVVEPGAATPTSGRARTSDAAVLARRRCVTRSPMPVSHWTRTSRGDRGDPGDGAERPGNRGLPGGHRVVHRAARGDVHRQVTLER